MKVIGLCGGSGSGKGTLARMLAENGFLHIDADEVYHELTSSDGPCLREMADAFGTEIISDDGALDRRALSSIVFNKEGKEKLHLLNSIAHRYVLDEIRKRISLVEGAYTAAIVDAPLLFESGFNKECDLIVSVFAPREMRVSRIGARDGITEDAAKRRIDAQLSDEFLRLHSDIIIINDKDIASLRDEAEKLINTLKENGYDR